MKKILIISENDLTAVKLTELYHSIYSHATKELIMCTIDLSECRSGGMTLPYKKPTMKLLANAPNPLKNFLLQSKPKKRVNVKNCKEIVDIIKKEGIRTVLIPIFLYDTDKANQLNVIVQEVKRKCKVEVIGVFI